MRVLYDLKDSLPDVLYLQMDNCGRENKNKYAIYRHGPKFSNRQN